MAPSPRLSRETSAVSIENEKTDKLHIDDVNLERQNGGTSPNTDPVYLKKMFRRIDWHLIPILTITYAVSLIDRQNVANAAVAGMNKELQLQVGNRYSVILLVFFAPYVLFELPSNIALRYFGAARWLSAITLFWGITIVCMGLSTHWTHLVICRVFLGIFEAGFFPGCVYVVSCWYTRYETGKRLSALYLGSHIFSGLGGILAVGLRQINVGSYHGWRWIFIIEGIFTVACGIAAYFLVVDFPEKAKFLNNGDKEIVMHLIDVDRADAHTDAMTFKGIMRDLTDWKIWSFGWNSLVNLVISGVYTYFGQNILLSMGFSLDVALIMIFPASIAAVIIGFIESIYSDKTHLRAPFIIFNELIWIVGALLIRYTVPNASRLLGIFCIVIGSQANFPIVVTYQANNVRGNTKRGVASAIQIGMGGVGGIVGSLIFRAQDRPHYTPGILTAIGLALSVIINVSITSYVFWKQNKKQAEGKLVIAGLEGFRYTY